MPSSPFLSPPTPRSAPREIPLRRAAPSKTSPQFSERAPYVLVALDRTQSSIDHELTYSVPSEMRDVLSVGVAVLVPVARQYLTGYVTGFVSTLEFDARQLRPISRLVSRVPLFDAKALQVARWMSAYYHCSLSECLCCYIPNGCQQTTEKRYMFAAEDWEAALRPLSRAPRQLQVAQLLLQSEKALSQKEIQKSIGGADVRDTLKRLVEDGTLSEEDELLDPTMKPRRVQAVRLSRDALLQDEPWHSMTKAAPKQAEALKKLFELHASANSEILSTQEKAAAPTATLQLAREWNIDLGALRGLEKKGFIEFTTLEQSREPTPHLPPRDTHRVRLTDEQQVAVKAINEVLKNTQSAQNSKPQSATVLLQGVTASGKTEVYLRAIEECLTQGRRAIVLVPEIALTAQTVEIFQRRFQERVAILHSALGAGERFDEWRRARAGRADIIVGARSAVFAPCRDVGLIIIDEEHDHSYKQDAAPRYHARDVALKRAALDGAVVVLGSATPSLETYHRATRGDYVHLKMTRRIEGRAMPNVEIVDMTHEAKMGQLPVLSTRLKEALCETMARGEQAILFLNRRGFAVYVQCLGCGHVERCPNCDVALTFHRGERTLRCHHCDHAAPVIETCPECDGWMIGFSGTGTEKVESEVNDLFAHRGLSNAKILRLDRDTTSRKGSHGRILGEFRQGRAQVLIGTQMVTKGLDFPNVTLVGVIAADSALNMPDFRAAERTFQLLAQVSGRAGRGDRSGRVLIQTLADDHYAIEAARAHDYESFVKQELSFRGSPPYPPFSHIVNIISQDESEGVARAKLDELAIAFLEAIARENPVDENGESRGTELLGPVDCPLGRVKNKFRFHLMLRDRNRPRLHRVLEVFDKLPREARVGLIIDVDAMALL